MVLLIIIGVLVLILLLVLFSLLFSQIRVEVFFTYKDHRKDLLIQVVLWKYIKFRRNIPVIDINAETMSVDLVEKDEYLGSNKEKKKSFTIDDLKQQWRLIEEVLKTTKNVIPHVKMALKAIHIHRFNWHTMLGVTRADHTAVLTGLLYSLKGGFAAMIMSHLTYRSSPVYSIQPYYVKPTYQTELECILSFKLGKIMRELFTVLKQYGKLKKVGS